MTREKVVIIIINYKTTHLISKLIDSVKEDLIEVSFLIVDNEATENSYNDLKKINDTRIEILTASKNLGFTGGVNFALNHILLTGTKIKYFCLLNPDALSSNNVISGLVQIIKKYPKAACISPQVLNLDGSPWYSGARINYSKGEVTTSLNLKFYAEESYLIDVFSGCAVLFLFDKVIEAGCFNNDLFMYYDEAELSIKFSNLGYEILFTPHFQVYHDASYTTRNISFLKTYYMTRNKFLVFNKTMSFYNKVFFIIHEFAFHLKNRRLKNAIYHVKGYYDFLCFYKNKGVKKLQ